MSENLSKNDIKWLEIFEVEKILESVVEQGFCLIKASTINEYREARLMTKFDHASQLPKPFRDNDLSIQPVSRSEYIIGPFDSYYSIPKNKAASEVQYVEMPPHIKTIVPQKISSESSAVLCAYLSGMLTLILGEETSLTVFGRMSTGSFDYLIKRKDNTKYENIDVRKSQCEIDGGFEGTNKFAIIEAKCLTVNDFIIRQLFYPFKLWISKTKKEVVPIFLCFSNNIFTFYIFRFTDSNIYNSLELISEHRFCIGRYEIELEDIKRTLNEITVFEPEKAEAFPQADIFVRIVDLLSKLYYADSPLNKETITTEYDFDVRQSGYYIAAGKYLGLIERVADGNIINFKLTNKGKSIIEADPRSRNLELVRTILSHEIFYKVLKIYLETAVKPTRKAIMNIMSQSLDYSQSTLERRSQTVEKWIDWIIELTCM